MASKVIPQFHLSPVVNIETQGLGLVFWKVFNFTGFTE